MRIALDIRPLQLPDTDENIRVYIYNFLHNLSFMDGENEYLLMVMQDKEIPKRDFPSRFRHTYLEIPALPHPTLNILFDKLNMEKVIAKHNPQVIHFTDPFSMNLNFDVGRFNRQTLLTIHTLAPHLYPDDFFSGKKGFQKPVYQTLFKNIPKAGHVVCLSQSIKKDLIRILDLPDHKISVIYGGYNPDFGMNEHQEQMKNVMIKYNLPERFILYPGGFRPHQNLKALLEALVILKIEYLTTVELAVIGGGQEELKPIKERAEELHIEKEVHFLGAVKEKEIPLLYNIATALVLPFKYGGFPLSMLSAFACGTPVICSNIGSFMEIGKDAVHSFDPHNIDNMAEVLNDVWSSQEIRQEMRMKGMETVRGFRWGSCVSETLSLYRLLSNR